MSFLVGKNAPDFTSTAIMPDGSVKHDFTLSKYLSEKKGVLFFYPLDFTFVCPSEIIEFHKKIDDFKSRGTLIIGVSVDSEYTHLAYKNTPVNEGGIGNIQYPLVSDLTKDIARSYDVLFDHKVALRGTFIIDENFIIKHQTVNDLSIGRNVGETLRLVDALKHNQKYGEVCPANWSQGDEAIKPNTDGIKKYLRNRY